MKPAPGMSRKKKPPQRKGRKNRSYGGGKTRSRGSGARARTGRSKTRTEKTESPIVTESVISDAAVDKTEARRARRVRTIGRAAELFDEYLSAQSDEEKKKLTDSIDCIVVDKDKK
ncbi:MAG: hypothetical protein ACLUSP_02550 [Christensenellales bacterium]